MPTDPFLELQQALERDLAATGFAPSNSPPTAEPTIAGRLRAKSEEYLKDLYDDLLNFYDYLTEQITRCVLRQDAAKARVVYIRAKAMQSVSKLPNAEARKNAVEVDPEVVEVTCDYLYYRQMHEAMDERRRKNSKAIERVSRELYLRNSKYGNHQTSFSAQSSAPARPSLDRSKLSFTFGGDQSQEDE